MFRSPFSFDGRIRRLEFGLSMIVYVVVYGVALSLIAVGNTVTTALGAILFIPMVWFVWAQGAKRCHDIDKSGWWQLIPFFVLVMLFQNGSPGKNEYGRNPKEGADGAFNTVESETLDGHMTREN